MKKAQELKYKKFNKPFNIKDWTLGTTREGVNIVVLFLQGGPGKHLYFDENVNLKAILKSEDLSLSHKESIRTYFKITKNFKENLMKEYDLIQVKQTHNVKKGFTETTKYISLETSRKEQRENIAILDKVIKHYKQQKKKVVVIGHSVGGYIINNYLSVYKPKADLFVVGNSRLDVPVAFPAFIDQENIIPFFNKDGKFFDDDYDFKFLPMKKDAYKRVALSLVYTRFSEKLKNKDLSKVIYVTCHEDMWLSSLSTIEKELIKKQGGKIIETTSSNKDKLNKLSFKYNFGATAHTTVFLEPVVKIMKKEIDIIL